MGGSIAFSSAVGEGSLFCFEIPLQRVEAPPAKTPEADGPTPPAGRSARSMC